MSYQCLTFLFVFICTYLHMFSNYTLIISNCFYYWNYSQLWKKNSFFSLTKISICPAQWTFRPWLLKYEFNFFMLNAFSTLLNSHCPFSFGSKQFLSSDFLTTAVAVYLRCLYCSSHSGKENTKKKQEKK